MLNDIKSVVKTDKTYYTNQNSVFCKEYELTESRASAILIRISGGLFQLCIEKIEGSLH